MYAVRGASPTDLDELREELSALGHSVVIVGDQAVAQVHVHLGDAGAAVEAALPRGRLSQIRITALPPNADADHRADGALGGRRAWTGRGGVVPGRHARCWPATGPPSWPT